MLCRCRLFLSLFFLFWSLFRFFFFFFFFFNDTATTEIYTLSLHDALPICVCWRGAPDFGDRHRWRARILGERTPARIDRKSTRLNSSHPSISYAVFCLKKKKKNNTKRYEYEGRANTGIHYS